MDRYPFTEDFEHTTILEEIFMKDATILPITIHANGVAKMLSCCEATVWKWLKEDPNFPKPRRFGKRCTLWLYKEVEDYIMNRGIEEA